MDKKYCSYYILVPDRFFSRLWAVLKAIIIHPFSETVIICEDANRKFVRSWSNDNIEGYYGWRGRIIKTDEGFVWESSQNKDKN